MNAKRALEMTLAAIKNKDHRRKMEIMDKIAREADRGNRALKIDLLPEDVKYFESLGYKYTPKSVEVLAGGVYMMNLPFLRW